MSYIVPKEIPNCCGRCPCFHAEHPMYCQAVKADKNKKTGKHYDIQSILEAMRTHD